MGGAGESCQGFCVVFLSPHKVIEVGGEQVFMDSLHSLGLPLHPLPVMFCVPSRPWVCEEERVLVVNSIVCHSG